MLANAARDYVLSQGQVVEVRRRILRADPSLEPFHDIANAHFGAALQEWLEGEGTPSFRARITAALVLAVVRVAFLVWDPERGGGAAAGGLTCAVRWRAGPGR
ncbi:hypothetical protein ACWCY6_16025 [Streptomyces sp. 900105755]|uniref:hypothetical protein n=1 Tax=Streptomyces sp. NPDC001507 TaxID=3364579 RepID=UPI0036B15E58